MVRISDVMTRQVITVTPETTLRDAADLFARHHISGAPVLAGHEVVGVVSATDLLEFVSSHYAIPREQEELESRDTEYEARFDVEDERAAIHEAEELRQAASDSNASATLGDGPADDLFSEYTVGDVMTRNVWSLPSTALLSVAARFMLDREIHRLVVLEDGCLAGVISTSDLARALAGPVSIPI